MYLHRLNSLLIDCNCIDLNTHHLVLSYFNIDLSAEYLGNSKLQVCLHSDIHILALCTNLAEYYH